MAFTDDFSELYDSEIVAYPVALDEYGDWVPSGGSIAIPCRVEGAQRVFRTAQGGEVFSSYAVYLAGFYNLSTRNHRFSIDPVYIPYGVLPSGLLAAQSIEKVADEDGPCYEVVYI